MAQKGIREFDAKRMLAEQLGRLSGGRIEFHGKVALATPATSMSQLGKDHPWLKTDRLVVKPDQLFGKRGKNGLVFIGKDKKGATFAEAETWINERMEREATLHSGITGQLTHFLIEPFTPHDTEYYVAFTGTPEGDTIHFSTAGGVDVEENHDKLLCRTIGINVDLTEADLRAFAESAPEADRETLMHTVKALFAFYRKLHFGMLEINPFAISGNQFIALDAVARLDSTADFVCKEEWGTVEFPASFGQTSKPSEAYIAELDAKTGSSLKLTILNPKGRIWTMVAGGGASVIYADTVVDLGFGNELANYGEYSGDPSREFTREYAKTIMKEMTENNGKVLLIGGGIANFTDVAKTFDGIIDALEEYATALRAKGVRIFVRRGGPNYKLGLSRIREAATRLGLNMEVYGPEEHMTRIVREAVGCLI